MLLYSGMLLHLSTAWPIRLWPERLKYTDTNREFERRQRNHQGLRRQNASGKFRHAI